jgi:sepiapterin reductase
MNPSSESLCVVITGASRGLGQAIAVQFAKHATVRSLILIGRTSLESTKQEACTTRETGVVLDVSTIQADLGNLETLDDTIAQISNEVLNHRQECDRLIIVSNAGSLGFIGKAVDTPSIHDIQSAIDLNVTSALWLAIRLTRLTSAAAETTPTLIVNISSLVAVQPFPTLALYSAGKAARESFFQAMAAEGVRTLNYAPGPLETEMTQEIRASNDLDASLKPHYAKELINPIDSARILVDLVINDKFESGQHIDYYDVRQQ